MQKGREAAFFTLMCGNEELREHLAVCEHSGFRLAREARPSRLSVFDRETIVLHATKITGGHLVLLHARYYRHPFSPSGGGDAPPGVP